MNTNNHSTHQLRTILFGMACVIAGVVCFANGVLHHAAPAMVQTGERQGVSSPSAISHRDLSAPTFTSLSPRYGTKPIAEIKVGEEVVTRDTTTGEMTTRKVLNAFRRVSTHLRILTVVDPATQETQTIETTDEHPFWVSQRGDWIKAKELNSGDQFDDASGGNAVLVASEYEPHPEGIAVFNFEVEDFHNYYVKAHGSRGPPVLAHNANCNDLLSVIDVHSPGIDGLPVTGRFGDGVQLQINVDTGTAVAFVSQGSPVRHSLKSQVAGKQMVMSQTAVNELQVNLRSAGPLEKARADRLMKRVQIISDKPSARALGLRVTGSVGANDKIIFGTGDSLGITTMTNDAKFLRGAKEQGVVFQSFLHPPVPFKGM